MSPRPNTYQSRPLKSPAHVQALMNSLGIRDPDQRSAHLHQINQRFGTKATPSVKASAAPAAISDQNYVAAYKVLYRNTAGDVGGDLSLRWPAIHQLQDEYRLARLTAESRSVLEKERQLKENPAARLRLADLRRTRDWQLATNEFAAIELPRVY